MRTKARTKIVNLDLDVSQSRRIGVVDGIDVTAAPDKITGAWKVSQVHCESAVSDANMDHIARRVSAMGVGGDGVRIPHRESKNTNTEDFMFMFGPMNSLNRRRMIQVDRFADYARDEFINRIMDLDRADSGAPIAIMITSYGGAVYSLFGMLGFTEIVSAPVYTVVVDTAFSCGAVLAAAGAPKGNRFITSNGQIMVHEISAGAFGQMPDIEATAEMLADINKRLFETLARNTNKTAGEWMDIVRNKQNKREHFFFPEEAIELGLVDAVLDKEKYRQLFTGGQNG